ncbi:cytotoxic necrotizing factor Rho-activating domain-containing protein [Paraburkholderia rhizosphaerae]|nr:cytotoxic necrotizing factor Rho-activating domain-containing protein [Paraburkholderia rhizosphaerae]
MPAQPNDTLKHYPDAAQMVPRLLHFEQRVLEIRERKRSGGELSVDETDALKLYDALHDRLAFLHERVSAVKGEPVAHARIEDPPRDEKQREKTQPVNHGPDDVKYVGGVTIKADYTLRDVLATTANAAKSPFASFVSSTKDLIKKATTGEPLSATEEQEIYRYAGIADAFIALTPKGNLIQRAGDALGSLSDVLAGETPDSETLQSDLTNSLKSIQPKQSTSTNNASTRKSGTPVAPAQPAQRAASKAKSDYAEPQDFFDFPRFKIRFPFDDHSTRTVDVVRKSRFNPPQRQPDGRVGYPLSPTTPPRLPAEKTGKPATPPVLPPEKAGEPAAGPSGATGGEATSVPAGDVLKATGTPTKTDGRRASAPDAMGRPSGDLRRIAGKGPIGVTLASSPLDDNMRVRDFKTSFYFYRKDRDVKDMSAMRAVRGTDYEHRRDVLAVGNGEQATSYIANSKINAGTFWGHGPASHLQGAELIELGNGRDGVGAVKLPFANVRPGATVIVSGGAMNGCTMLFASDGTSLYAYHAGSTELSPAWRTAREGTRSIVDAHTLIGPKDHAAYRWHGTHDDLIVVGRQYPFSALIYSGQYLANTYALIGAGSVLGAVAGPTETIPGSHLHVARHAYGSGDKPKWHMMTFNYYDHDVGLRTIGTAEAVISKDLNGKVTVSVLAEKGKLDRGSSIGERGGPIAYRYRAVDSESAVYHPPG